MDLPAHHPTSQRPVIDLVSGSRVMARARPWSTDPDVAMLTLLEARPVALAVDVSGWLTRLAEAGYRSVRTSAVTATAATVLERFGFRAIQHLTVLALGPVAVAHHAAADHGPWTVRALRWRTDALRPRREVTQALEIDRDAFGEPWCLDLPAWRDALHATPQRRITTVSHERDVIGFAITGASSEDGFLQRLAVAPAFQRRGVARALVHDAIAWVAGQGRRQVLVNTARDNQRALALYRSLGFQSRPDELVVMEGAVHHDHAGAR